MSLHLHLVRTGSAGEVGRFNALDAVTYRRGQRVIVRTERGLETGEVMVPPPIESTAGRIDGPLIRAMTTEDMLLEERLVRHRQRAFDSCVEILSQRQLPVHLMDVEHLFDGKTLVFHFLGDEPPELADVVNELTERYESQVEFRKFAEALTLGCGPDCGTEAAAGNGCSTCSTGCAVSDICGH